MSLFSRLECVGIAVAMLVAGCASYTLFSYLR